MIELAPRLKAALASHRVEDVARQVGVTASAIYNWLSGANEPSLAKLIALAGATKVSVEWLATGKGEMQLQAPGYLAPTWPGERAAAAFRSQLVAKKYRGIWLEASGTRVCSTSLRGAG